MTFTPNLAKITAAILAAKIAPTARETAAEIVDAWIQTNGEYDATYRTVAVETPWAYRLQPKTWLVGVMDRHAQDDAGLLGCEWKTGKEPKQNRDGQDSAWWNEDVWLEQMRDGVQLAVYGIALRKGIFYGKGRPYKIHHMHNPRILIRLAVKSQPPRFWPTKPEDGIFQFPGTYLDIVERSLIARAEAIRAARRSEMIPWAVPGIHCENKFHRKCAHLETCLEHKNPPNVHGQIFDPNDPGSAAIVAAGIPVNDPETVILSASSIQASQECLEKYRIHSVSVGEKESDEGLDVGTGVHCGVAEYYRQQMISQDHRTRETPTGRVAAQKKLQKR